MARRASCDWSLIELRCFGLHSIDFSNAILGEPPPNDSVSFPVVDNDFTTLTPSAKGNQELRTVHASVVFQPGSVVNSTLVTMEERALVQSAAPSNSSFGPVVYLGPHGQKFEKKYSVTIRFPAGAQPGDTSSVNLLYSATPDSEPAVWKDITSDPSYDVQFGEQKVTFSTDHFCIFGLRFGHAVLFHLHFEQPLRIAILFDQMGILRLTPALQPAHVILNDNPGFKVLESFLVPCHRGDRICLSIQPYSFRCESQPVRDPPARWVERFSVTSINTSFTFEDRVTPTMRARQVGDEMVCEGRADCQKCLPRAGAPPEALSLGSRVIKVGIPSRAYWKLTKYNWHYAFSNCIKKKLKPCDIQNSENLNCTQFLASNSSRLFFS